MLLLIKGGRRIRKQFYMAEMFGIRDNKMREPAARTDRNARCPDAGHEYQDGLQLDIFLTTFKLFSVH